MTLQTDSRTGRGYHGEILHVDLSSGRTEFESLSDDFYRRWLGGLGLGVKVLWDRIQPGADPLGPGNVLGFVTGLLTDTGTLFSGRFMVVGKSPLTGGWGDSNCGGYFSPFLKKCGLDGLFFHGASESPVYVFLDGERVEVHEASDLWGLDAVETDRALKARHGRSAQVACIGPAGEKQCRFAGILTDGGRYAGRSGLGAVMGSKHLKAVVVAGRKKAGLADREEMGRLTRAFRRRIEGGRGMRRLLGDRLLGFMGWLTRKNPIYTRQPADLFRQVLGKYGTAGLTALSAESGDSPIRNWGGVGHLDFPLKRSQKIGAEAVIRYEVKKYGCYSCPVKCGGLVKVPDGPWPIEEMHKPEYETVCGFGGLLLNDDLHSIFKLNDLVNRGGLDSISCAGVVAFAIECFENGLLTLEDTGGLELGWGRAEAVIGLVEMIIERRGLGDVLAEGVRLAAEKIGRGSERFAVHCGGVEAPMHDPKFDPGFAPIYHCDPTPGRHTTASYTYLDLQLLEKRYSRAPKIPGLTTFKQRHTYENTGPALAACSAFKMLIDGLGLCLFGVSVGGDMPIAGWVNAATGWDLTDEDCLTAGERIMALRQAFNAREGLEPVRDFKPHGRIYGRPALEKGPARHVTIDIETMAGSYCEALGWDPRTGRPTRDGLERLGLSDVAEVLYPAG
ncbi:MAG: aldehyde ferredoxin oxidoreductase family protein [Proteobacteria bacterium]|nr:aldehyde ferredoxin oxidoreductase family protein [Pseudomonadota bacterium]